MKTCKFEDLLGHTLKTVSGKVGDQKMVFKTDSGRTFQLIHHQDCCEDVSINDICGDLQDLIGTPILQAEENSNKGESTGTGWDHKTSTWTFYRISTMRGQVVIRWFGTSTGEYSESAEFEEVV